MTLRAAALGALALLPLALALPALGADFWYGDESRHALNGVFLRDWLAAGCPAPLPFARDWYARCPGLSLGYHPPLVPALFAAAYGLTGVSIDAAHLVVALAGSACAAAWFVALRDRIGVATAAAVVLLLCTAPETVLALRSVMLEAPALACLAAATAFLLASVSRPGLRPAAFALAAAAAWCKPLAAVWAAAAWLWLADPGRGPAPAEDRRMTRASLALFAILLLPLGLLTWKFGQVNLADNVGAGGDYARWSLANWTWYLARLDRQLGWPLAALGAVGAGLALRRRDALDRLLVFWLGISFVAVSLVSYKSTRLGILWIPAWSAFAARALASLAQRLPARVAGPAVLLVAGALSLGNALTAPAPRVDGLAAAAAFVDREWSGSTVLYDGLHNGSFLFRLRQLDPERRRICLRGSKSLSVTRIMPRFGVKPVIADEAGLVDFLRRHRTGLLAVETEDPLDLPHAALLRRTLRSRPDLFERIALFPIASTEAWHRRASPLEIWRFKEAEALPAPERLTLEFLTTGETIEIPLPPAQRNGTR